MASSTSNSSFNYAANDWVLIFNDESYDYWSIGMKTLLVSEDANELITWDDDKKKDYLENQNRDSGALSYLHKRVYGTISPRIMAATTAKDVWTILQTEFKGSNKVITIYLQSLWLYNVGRRNNSIFFQSCLYNCKANT